MLNSKNCEIDDTLSAIERTIENRKIQIKNDQVTPSFAPVVSYLYSEMLNKAGGQHAQLTNALRVGREFAQGFLNKARQSMQEEPWVFVRTVAMYSFAIGLFLSLRQRRSPRGVKA